MPLKTSAQHKNIPLTFTLSVPFRVSSKMDKIRNGTGYFQQSISTCRLGWLSNHLTFHSRFHPYPRAHPQATIMGSTHDMVQYFVGMTKYCKGTQRSITKVCRVPRQIGKHDNTAKIVLLLCRLLFVVHGLCNTMCNSKRCPTVMTWT